MKPEILAPAGSSSSLLAALHAGADAVYGGLKVFSARASAENFTESDLPEMVALCHKYCAKFYLTVNTLLFDDEFEELEQALLCALHCDVDGFLVQDFGVLAYLRALCPDAPVHASTQMTLHTPAGLEWAAQNGISRVVVPRELSKEEMQALCRAAEKENIEIEAFVHGAHCMCISGQCRLSAMIGGRSANRGHCAQTCRLPFSANPPGNKQHPVEYAALSLKDMCLIPHVQEMEEMGVASLKIEGRCKRPEYAGAAVTAVRQALKGEKPDLDTLGAVFSRSGFTDGYYTHRIKDMFGIRTKGDVMAAKDVLPELSKRYKQPDNLFALDFFAQIIPGQPLALTVSDLKTDLKINCCGEPAQAAAHAPISQEMITAQLEKLGDTPYYLHSAAALIAPNAYAPVSALNKLRRDAIKQLNQSRAEQQMHHYQVVPVPALPQPEPSPVQSRTVYRVMLGKYTREVPVLLAMGCEVIVPLGDWRGARPEEIGQLIFALPVYDTDEEDLTHTLRCARHAGAQRILCENPAHILLGKALGFTLYGGIGLPVTNRRAQAYLEKEIVSLTLSPELSVNRLHNLDTARHAVYVYGYIPVMTTAQCPVKAQVGCRQCKHRLYDRTGRAFPVLCDQYAGGATIFNAVPVWLADKAREIPGQIRLLDCTLDTINGRSAVEILQKYQSASPAKGEITRGLYFRKVR